MMSTRDLRSATDARLNEPPLPALLGALLAAILAVGLLARTGTQWQILLIESVAMLGFIVGSGIATRGWPLVGFPVSVVGAMGLCYSFFLAITQVSTVMTRVILLPGMIGAGLLCVGLLVGRPTIARGVVVAGSGCLFLGVLLAGVAMHVSLPVLLGAGGATIVAWDLAEYGISLGRQVGARARTARVTAIHVSATVAVGASLVGAVLIIDRLPLGELSLLGFLLLTVTTFALLLALRQ